MSFKFLRYVNKYRQYYTVSSNSFLKKHVEKQQLLAKSLQDRIKLTGPITVADYMKEVLTNPYSGYYMHNDVFGNKGDFVTSPELGQLFGEIVGIWFINEWEKIGSPKPFQIIELGPGRGSLCQDILRVFKHFKVSDVSVNLVEVSPHLSDLQSKKLCLNSKSVQSDSSLCYKTGITTSNIPINWYYKIEDVPKAFSLIVAHEFFDALPVQKFQKTEKGWREILIDVDENSENKFKFVLSNKETLGSKLLISKNESRHHIEVSKDAITITNHIAGRIEEDGGIALIADYGHNGDGKDTFRGFKEHKLHDPLLDPGSADLTADVDFNLLKAIAETDNKTITFGPVLQSHFLETLGIRVRVEQLLKNATVDEKKALEFALKMMTDEDQMGKRFKLLSIFPEVLKSHLAKFPVAGFV